MELLGMGSQGSDSEAYQSRAHQLPRYGPDPSKASSLEPKPDNGSPLCSTQTPSTRLATPGCSSGHSLETRYRPSNTRSERVVEPYPTLTRKWNHSACLDPHSAGWSAEESFGYGHLDQAEEMIRWIRTHALASNGATCYLTSTLIAQMWAQP